ncbi:MAG: hypothetical protein H7Y32_07460, partial [Chloroflexales bacterium]|nr:hypothetical protein [Chloroflexales bacterium]
GIFLAVCITGFVLMALLAPQVPAAGAPQARVLWEAGACYTPWLASA